MATAGACHAKKSAQVFAVRRWKSNEDWMARTCHPAAAAISGCAIAQHPGDRPQVLPAYGLQDLRNEHQDPKTKSNPNPNTMCLLITPGGNRGTGHFYLAKNRTFLLCVDRAGLTAGLTARSREGGEQPNLGGIQIRWTNRCDWALASPMLNRVRAAVPNLSLARTYGRIGCILRLTGK